MKTFYRYSWDSETKLFRDIALSMSKSPFANCMVTENFDSATLSENIMFRFYGPHNESEPEGNHFPFFEFASDEETLMETFKSVKNSPEVKKNLREFKKTIPERFDYAETVFIIRAVNKDCKKYKFSIYFRHTGEQNSPHLFDQ